MYIIINWSHPTKFSIEQEPLKIFKICDTFIFLALQSTHMPKTSNSAYKEKELYHFKVTVALKISFSKKAKICERQGMTRSVVYLSGQTQLTIEDSSFSTFWVGIHILNMSNLLENYLF